MNNYFLKVAAAAITLAAVGYGAYKLYQKYCGAKIAKQNKFRSKFEDMSYNFDDDEYLEDDDVYYFGQGDNTVDVEDPEIEIEVTAVPAQEPENGEAEEAQENYETIDEIPGSTAE